MDTTTAPKTPHKRYEQMVRGYTMFFSAMMGFGLKAVIDHPAWGYERWVCFAITLPLFLRYLLGSSNQLWYEYVREDPGPALRSLMLWDFCWLLAFGMLGMFICYADTVQHFLWLTTGFGVLATLAPLWDKWMKNRKNLKMNEFWPEWFVLNGLFTVLAAGAGILYGSELTMLHSFFAVDWALIMFAVASIIILIRDVRHQLDALDGEGRNDSKPVLRQRLRKV